MRITVLLISVVILAWLSGYLVKCLLDIATSGVTKPEKLTDNEWNTLKSPPGEKSGEWLGFIERILSVLVFYHSAFVVLGGWLALKLGSKWQTWSSIAKAPDSCTGLTDKEWFIARRSLASWLSQRFLIGTASNILLGWVVLAVSNYLAVVITC